MSAAREWFGAVTSPYERQKNVRQGCVRAERRRYEQTTFGLACAVRAAQKSRSGKKRWARLAVAARQRIAPMPDKALDPVEWELVRADIAMEKARLKANGDWSKWEEFQSQTNIRWARMR